MIRVVSTRPGLQHHTHELARNHPRTTHTKPGKTRVEFKSAWTWQNPDPGEPGNTWPGPSERKLKRVQILANKLPRIMEQSLAEGKCVCTGQGEQAWQNPARPHTRPGKTRFNLAWPHTKPGKARPGNISHYKTRHDPARHWELINPAQPDLQEGGWRPDTTRGDPWSPCICYAYIYVSTCICVR